MRKRRGRTAEPSFLELVEGIVADVERLVGQQLELFRGEVNQQLREARSAAASGAVGAGLVAVGGVLSTQMVVHAVQRATRLPLWASYGLVGGLLGGAGLAQLNRARRQAAGVRLTVPPQTAQTLKENMAWLQEQTTGGRT